MFFLIGMTSITDAYLTPHIKTYISSFLANFQANFDKNKLLFMQSDGGLTNVANFSGCRSILSGPAGGVVGYALTTVSDIGMEKPIIGFDMGGTSTDVSRYDGKLEHKFESEIADVIIQSPQLDIHTVAAGGGSRLYFRVKIFNKKNKNKFFSFTFLSFRMDYLLLVQKVLVHFLVRIVKLI